MNIIPELQVSEPDSFDIAMIKNQFSYHPPQGTQTARYEAIRSVGAHFADLILRICPDTGDRSTAILKLRETVMWANASIACGETDCHTPV